MGNSSLVDYTLISPHKNSPRNHAIDTITIHHMAGNMSVEACGKLFQQKRTSSNYGIGSDGRVGLYVEEKDRSWCSSSSANDHRAITIEVANDVYGGDWHVSDNALSTLIDLCTDICKRNNISRLNYTGDKTGNLTMHCWFAPTACPGPYLKSKYGYIAEQVNLRLKPPVEKPQPVATVKSSESVNNGAVNNFLPQRGYFVSGDVSPNVGKIASFMRSVFPSYTNKQALGNTYGPNLIAAISEFQRRTGLTPDGMTGKITLGKLIEFGFSI